MTSPIVPQPLFVTVDGVSYRTFGYDTLNALEAAVSDAIAGGTTLRLSVMGAANDRQTHGTLFLVSSRVSAVVVSDAILFTGQHGTDVVPGQHGTDDRPDGQHGTN